MAQGKINDLAGKFSKGPVKGLGVFAAFAGAAALGISQSMFTGNFLFFSPIIYYIF